jgi:hypothetical protein
MRHEIGGAARCPHPSRRTRCVWIAGWIGYQQFLVGEPPWLWLTRTGLAAYNLASYNPAPHPRRQYRALPH